MIGRRRDATKNLRGVPRKKAEWAEIQQNVTALTTEYSQLLNRKNEVQRDRLLAASNFQENFQLVDPAKIPNIPTEPKKGKFMGVGIGLTAAIGILLAVGREGFRQTFVSAKELEEATGMQVVAVLPNISNFGKEGTS